MKKAFYTLYIALLCGMVGMMSACQDDMDTAASEVGYLRLNIEANSYVNVQTKVAEDYNPKQIAVQILSGDQVVNETADWEEWKDSQIQLLPGTYTIVASSNGFDGSESGFDIPYYTGSQEVTIEKGVEKTADIVCTLANVKVTVEFDQSFIDAFQSATATVASEIAGVTPLDFVMGEAARTGYFPVGDLTSTIKVVNKDGESYESEYPITNVQARDYYKLRYKVEGTGMGSITITTDGTETVYEFTFKVSTEAATKLTVDAANAWGKLAFLSGKVTAKKEGQVLDVANMKFEYRPQSAEEWQSVQAVENGTDAYKATVTGLTANTTYEYRMTYQSGDDSFTSEAVEFTTEEAPDLYNGDFDDWYQSGRTWYAMNQDDFNAGTRFWDSSNPGTTQDLGAMINVNPTTGESTVVHTSGGQSAKLHSQYASAFGIGQFAAASLYTGTFGETKLSPSMGATIDFGQEFTSRPTHLQGFYQYAPVIIDNVVNPPSEANIVEDETMDMCAIYIALMTDIYPLDNTNMAGTAIDWANWKDDSRVVAYGELPASMNGTTNGEWVGFDIPLEYRDLTTQPKYIVIVASASKYGDYFTGGDGSVLYLDDFSLTYPETEDDIKIKE